MRKILLALATSVAFTACVSGTTRVIYVPVPAEQTAQAPAPAPAPKPGPAPAPAPMPPVAVTIARVDDNRVLVSTNQPSYLAIFEIVPGRGLTLVYPASVRQRRVAVSGSNWLTVSRWSRQDDIRAARNDGGDRGDWNPRRGRVSSERHLYALASDRPLRLTDAAFDNDYLRRVVGARAWQDDEPYDAMYALSKKFVPPVADEDWAEDLFTMDVSRPAVSVRIARIYCPDGSVTYVREDMADRASCPWSGRGSGRVGAPMPRPDSVVASSGRPILRRPDQRGPAVFRVPKPDDEPVVEQQGARGISQEPSAAERERERARDEEAKRREQDERARAEEAKRREKEHQDNGNHYGQNRNGNNGNNGNNGSNGNGQGSDDVSKERLDPRSSKPENKPEQKPEAKPEQKPEAKPEQKPENRPEAKPEAKPDRKDEEKAKSNDDDKSKKDDDKSKKDDDKAKKDNDKAKPEAKPKGMRGVIDQMRASSKDPAPR